MGIPQQNAWLSSWGCPSSFVPRRCVGRALAPGCRARLPPAASPFTCSPCPSLGNKLALRPLQALQFSAEAKFAGPTQRDLGERGFVPAAILPSGSWDVARCKHLGGSWAQPWGLKALASDACRDGWEACRDLRVWWPQAAAERCWSRWGKCWKRLCRLLCPCSRCGDLPQSCAGGGLHGGRRHGGRRKAAVGLVQGRRGALPCAQ